jgi:hypothetical protein
MKKVIQRILALPIVFLCPLLRTVFDWILGVIAWRLLAPYPIGNQIALVFGPENALLEMLLLGIAVHACINAVLFVIDAFIPEKEGQ